MGQQDEEKKNKSFILLSIPSASISGWWVALSRTLPGPQAACVDSIAVLAMVVVNGSMLFEGF